MDIQETQPQQPSPQKISGPIKGLIVLLVLAVFLSFHYGYVVGSKGYTFVPKDFKVVGRDSLP
jgi:hypothetical protein